jgi:hypothetical protein
MGRDLEGFIISYLKTLGREPTLEDKQAAALQTWTGKLAQGLGFTTVQEISINNYDRGIEVIFAN